MALSDDVNALPASITGGTTGGLNTNAQTIHAALKQLVKLLPATIFGASLVSATDAAAARSLLSVSNSNVELAYAEVATVLAIDTSGSFTDAPGLAITVAPGARPMMIDAYLATVYGTGPATWGFRVLRVSDGVVMAEGVSNTTVDVGYPPAPQLRFRVPAGAASTTYKVQTNRWTGSVTGQINSQAVAGSGHRAYISAVSV